MHLPLIGVTSGNSVTYFKPVTDGHVWLGVTVMQIEKY